MFGEASRPITEYDEGKLERGRERGGMGRERKSKYVWVDWRVGIEGWYWPINTVFVRIGYLNY